MLKKKNFEAVSEAMGITISTAGVVGFDEL
jgi:hypothetical protein